jgi:hypothetical protein
MTANGSCAVRIIHYYLASRRQNLHVFLKRRQFSIVSEQSIRQEHYGGFGRQSSNFLLQSRRISMGESDHRTVEICGRIKKAPMASLIDQCVGKTTAQRLRHDQVRAVSAGSEGRCLRFEKTPKFRFQPFVELMVSRREPGRRRI